MAKAKAPASSTQLTQVVSQAGITAKQLRSTKIKLMTDVQRARVIGVATGGLVALKVPIVLSPAAPIKGTSDMELFSAMLVDPTWPAGSGQALFSSGFPAGVAPGVQVAFNRVKTGKTHLVEFYVTLNMNVAYRFRVFTFPLGDFVDVTIQGPKTTVIAALAPPVDQISGTLELGASIMQLNSVSDDAGWSCQSVQVNTIG
ncbi:MAG: hypothetical protein ABJE10_02170 [bacterium]